MVVQQKVSNLSSRALLCIPREPNAFPTFLSKEAFARACRFLFQCPRALARGHDHSHRRLSAPSSALSPAKWTLLARRASARQ
eukprot:9469467-Pyramimonas_sp.AAC.1